MIFPTDEELMHECLDVVNEQLPNMVPVSFLNLRRLITLSGIKHTWDINKEHTDVPRELFLEMVNKAEATYLKNKNPAGAGSA